MIEAYLNLLIGIILLWCALGILGYVISVVRFSYKPQWRSVMWALVFGPVVIIAAIFCWNEEDP